VRRPDLTLLLDVSVPVAAARRRAAGRETERYDADAVQERVAGHYRRLAAADPEGVRVLDGSGSIEQVAAAVAHAVDEALRTTGVPES
jgi:dTMP kinase